MSRCINSFPNSVVRREQVFERLRRVIDPELGVDIVALGLVYSAVVEGSRVLIRMTMTTPFCPLEEQFRKAVTTALQRLPGIKTVTIDFTFDPPWSPDKMQAGIREQLGMNVLTHQSPSTL